MEYSTCWAYDHMEPEEEENMIGKQEKVLDLMGLKRDEE
jgi:ssRNA-specific RNase YbeY (16S rRNA maturation enzyme)